MATLSSLVVNLVAQTGKFTAPIRAAEKTVNTFTRTTDRAAERIKQVETYANKASVRLLALKAAYAVATREAIKYADSVMRVEKNTGLMADSVQAFHYAVERSEADRATFDRGLRSLVRRASNARDGNAGLARSFDKLGVSLEDSYGNMRSVEEILYDMADGAAGFRTEAEASAALMDVMGNSGRQLVGFFRQGSEGIRDLMQVAIDNNLVLERRAIITLANLGNEVATTGERFKTMSRDLMYRAAPATRVVLGWVNELIDGFFALSDEQRQNIIRWTAYTAAVLGTIASIGVLARVLVMGLGILRTFGVVAGLAFNPLTLKLLTVGALVLLAIEHFDKLKAWWETSAFGRVVTDAWSDLEKTWLDPNLTLPQKTLKSVSIVVNTVVDLVDSIVGWWLKDAVVPLARKAVEMVGLDPDDNALVRFVEKIEEWWNNEGVTLSEKTIAFVGFTIGSIYITRSASWLASRVSAAILSRLGFMGAFAKGAAIKFALPALAIAGIGIVFMDEEAQSDFRESLQNSIMGLTSGLSGVWSGFFDELGKSWDKALEEGSLFDPLTTIIDHFTLTAATFRSAIGPIRAFLEDQIAQNLDIDVGEAFRRGLETGEIDVDPRASAFVLSIWDFGVSIAEMLWESIKLTLDIVDLIVLIFGVPLSGVVGVVADVGAQIAGAMIDGFSNAWEDYLGNKFKDMFAKSIIGQLLIRWGMWDPDGIGAGASAPEPTSTRDANPFLPIDHLAPPVSAGITGPLLGDRWSPAADELERFVDQLSEARGLLMTGEDFQNIARMVQAESENQPYEGMVGVAATILNRITSDRFPNTAMDVLSQPGQFEPFQEGGRFHEITEANTDALRAVGDALLGWDPTMDSVYFYNPEIVVERAELGQKGAQWILDATDATVIIGDHQFATLPGHQSGTPWTGWGATDEVAGVVHRREAVIPWPALKKGPAGVLEFLGMPGFQDGRLLSAPIMGAAAIGRPSATLTISPAQTKLEQLIDSTRGTIEMLRGKVENEALVGVLDMLLIGFEGLAEMSLQAESRISDLLQAIEDGPGNVEEMMNKARQMAEEEADMLERQARVTNTVNSALGAFATGLSEGNYLLAEFVRGIQFTPGEGIGFDLSGLINMGAQALGWLLGGGGRSVDRREARTWEAPDPYIGGGLIEALEKSRDLEAMIPGLEREVKQAQAFVQHMAGQFWNPGQQHRAAEALRVASEELSNARQALSSFDFTSHLGIDPASIARAVESGFDMADMSNMGRSMEDIIRNALVRAWSTSEEMVRLQTKFGDMLEGLVEDYMQTGIIGDLDDLRVVIAAIEERGEAEAEMLRELGLAAEDATNAISGMVNIPRGFKYALERVEASTAQPMPASVTPAPTATIHPRATSSVATAEGGGRGGDIIIKGDVYGWDDFKRKVDQANAESQRDGGVSKYGFGGAN